MTLVKAYTYEATKEAIDRADGKHINVYKLVRNDVSHADWERTKIKPSRRNQATSEDYRWPGRRDAGHTFRHVEGETANEDKSVYCDRHTAISVTRQILNSPAGQAALSKLQAQNLKLYDNATLRVTAKIAGTWLGKPTKNSPKGTIMEARCEITKLGNALWVHSTYPTRFAGELNIAS